MHSRLLDSYLNMELHQKKQSISSFLFSLYHPHLFPLDQNAMIIIIYLMSLYQLF